MTPPQPDSPTQGSEERLQPAAADTDNQHDDQDSENGGAMLSVDFSAPLAGPARSERIRQMSQNHPALGKLRAVQETLVKTQHSLRRLPGVSAGASNEIVKQLQQVGQVVSDETGKLFDAMANLSLDQQDTSRAAARMRIETGLLKAQNNDKAQVIRELSAELEATKLDRERLVGELQSLKGRAQADKDIQGRNGSIQEYHGTFHHAEEQINYRRSIWAPRNADLPTSAVHGVDSFAARTRDKDAMRRAVMGMNGTDDSSGRRLDADLAIRPISRPLTVAPPKFGPLQAGPPRGQSAFPSQPSSWTARNGQAGVSPFYTGPPPTSSAFRAPPTRKPYPAGPVRFRGDYQQPGYGMLEGSAGVPVPVPAPVPVPMPVPVRPSTAFGGSRQPSRENYPPHTPTSTNRAGRFSREQPADLGSASSTSTAVVKSSASSGGSEWAGGRARAPDTSDGSITSWNAQMMDFYAMIRAFVERHANLPDAHMALKMNTTSLWPVLLATYHPLSAAEAASYLDIHLRSDNPKCCLVTRVIIDYIVNRVWVPLAWAGSDKDTTFALGQLWEDFGRAQGQSSSLRQPLLERQAQIVETILKAEVGTGFHTNKVAQVTESLLSTIQPLLNRLTNPADAQRDMESVVELAWELSCRILTSRLTFDFRFPEVGSRFSSQSMLPIWPAMDPTDLQAKHWRVALVTTPVITCRSDTGGNISAHSISLADVYCMQ